VKRETSPATFLLNQVEGLVQRSAEERRRVALLGAMREELDEDVVGNPWCSVDPEAGSMSGGKPVGRQFASLDSRSPRAPTFPVEGERAWDDQQVARFSPSGP